MGTKKSTKAVSEEFVAEPSSGEVTGEFVFPTEEPAPSQQSIVETPVENVQDKAKNDSDAIDAFIAKLDSAVQSENITLKVKIGTFQYEGGTYQKGETFTAPKTRAEKFDAKDVTPI